MLAVAFFVLPAVVGLGLIGLVNVEGAHGQADEDEAQPFIVKEYVTSNAGYNADNNNKKHIYLIFH